MKEDFLILACRSLKIGNAFNLGSLLRLTIQAMSIFRGELRRMIFSRFFLLLFCSTWKVAFVETKRFVSEAWSEFSCECLFFELKQDTDIIQTGGRRRCFVIMTLNCDALAARQQCTNVLCMRLSDSVRKYNPVCYQKPKKAPEASVDCCSRFEIWIRPLVECANEH